MKLAALMFTATVAVVSALAAPVFAATTDKAIFAGGCFWCTESDFEKVPGVMSATSGYTGGKQRDPTYEEVSAGRTGHTEAVEVVFDPSVVSYEKLLTVFWYSIDPTVKDRQFCDTGSQYRSGIFYRDEQQQKLAEASKAKIEKSGVLKSPVQTEINQAGVFYPAEMYHQDYYKKNSLRYRYYRSSCGRDARLKQLWGDKAGSH